MNAEVKSARTIFLAAVDEAPGEERARYIDSACGGDETLRRKVVRLLNAYGDLNCFMKHAAAGAAPTIDLQPPEKVGTTIGRYKLLEQIGEGGMGVVYVAEQSEPIRRRVALKIIKPGMDTRQVIARFEAEQQALALMDHPNIAKVHDAGATEAGRPYFVMELVRGMPITEYCDQSQQNVRNRLSLFMTVCQAVQHAHQKGVIHRDIKPSNVLVTLHDGQPVVKVIDFGIAKAINQQLTERTIYTAFTELIGTPLYMSPEQAELSGLDVDTRSDVYALGVLLYEILTGHTPFDRESLVKSGLDEVRRMIREVEPPRPSHRISTLKADAVSTISQRRGIDQRQLTRQLRGELDWIVMKALEKDRNHRYESASAFAADIGRYLNDEPAEAGPPTLRYRLRKFVGRHRRTVAAVSVLSVLLLLLAGGLGWFARDRGMRQQHAEHAIQEALELGEPLLKKGNPNEPELLSAVRKAEVQLAQGLANSELERRVLQMRADRDMLVHLEQARLARSTVIDGHFNLQASVEAYANAFRQYGIDVQQDSPDVVADNLRARNISVDLVAAIEDWSSLLRQLRQLDESKRLVDVSGRIKTDEWSGRLRDVLRSHDEQGLANLAREASVDNLPVATIVSLAEALLEMQITQEAIELLKRAQPRHPDDFWINQDLGCAFVQANPSQPEEAVAYLRTSVALRPQSPGARLNLGYALSKCGRLDEATYEYEEAIRLKPNYVGARNNLAIVLLQQGRSQDAIPHLQEAIRLSPKSSWLRLTLGSCLRDAGQTDESLAAFQEAIRIDASQIGAYSGALEILEQQGRYDEAMNFARRGLAIQEKRVEDSPSNAGRRHELAGIQNNFATLLGKHGDSEQAESLLRSAIATERDLLAESPASREFRDYLANMHQNLGRWHVARGSYPEAESKYRDALSLREQLSADVPLSAKYQDALASVHIDLAQLLTRAERYAEAIQHWQEAIQRRPQADELYGCLGDALKDAGRFEEAILAFHQTIRLNPDVTTAYVALGEILCIQERHSEALSYLQRALASQQEQVAASPKDPNIRHALAGIQSNIAMILSTQDAPDQAEPLLRQAIETETQLLAGSPTKPEYLQFLGNMHINLGTLLFNRERLVEAESELRGALTHRRQLVEQAPSHAGYRADLVDVHVALVKVLFAQNQYEQGKAYCADAIGMLNELVDKSPSEESYRDTLTECHRLLAQAED